jgi:hypothetical protein
MTEGEGGLLSFAISLISRRNFTRASEALQNELFVLLWGTSQGPTSLEVVLNESHERFECQIMLEIAYMRGQTVHTRDQRVSEQLVVKSS